MMDKSFWESHENFTEWSIKFYARLNIKIEFYGNLKIDNSNICKFSVFYFSILVSDSIRNRANRENLMHLTVDNVKSKEKSKISILHSLMIAWHLTRISWFFGCCLIIYLNFISSHREEKSLFHISVFHGFFSSIVLHISMAVNTADCSARKVKSRLTKTSEY